MRTKKPRFAHLSIKIRADKPLGLALAKRAKDEGRTPCAMGVRMIELAFAGLGEPINPTRKARP